MATQSNLADRDRDEERYDKLFEELHESGNPQLQLSDNQAHLVSPSPQPRKAHQLAQEAIPQHLQDDYDGPLRSEPDIAATDIDSVHIVEYAGREDGLDADRLPHDQGFVQPFTQEAEPSVALADEQPFNHGEEPELTYTMDACIQEGAAFEGVEAPDPKRTRFANDNGVQGSSFFAILKRDLTFFQQTFRKLRASRVLER